MTIVTCDQVFDRRMEMLTGGKGHNLHALTAADFPVPRWTILGTDAFEAALAGLGVTVSQAPLTLEERLREAATIASVLRESPIPPAIRAEIDAAVRYLGPIKLSARSSARHEDSSRHSFAGLFDSFLNLTGADAVEDAVRMCWASAFSPRVTHYRHVRGVGFADIALAVIIQQFVEPVSSGVMFTANPVTGSSDQILISGVLGLGAGLVSGTVDSDSVRVDKNTREVLDETVVEKTLMVAATSSGGVEVATVPVVRQRESAINSAVRAELVDLACRLERHFGGPQDVEWTYDGFTTWVLQTRPITTLGDTAPAAEHLGETVPAGELRIWDNSNIIESFSGVTSPLTFTVARKLYEDVYRAYARSLNVPPAQLRQMEAWLPVMLGQFNGHVYYNLMHWYRMVGIAPGYPLNRRVLEVALGVSEPLDRKIAKSLHPFTFSSVLSAVTGRARIAATYARRYASIDAMVDDFDRKFAELIARQEFSDVAQLDGKDAYRLFRNAHHEVTELWGPMLVLDATLLTSVGLLAVLMKVFLPRAPEWFGYAVLNPGADVVSLEPARQLVDIVQFVDGEPALRAFIDSVDPAAAYPHLVDQAESATDPQWRELRRRIDDYIDHFGYRCPDELKLEAPDLRQNPAGIFHLMRMAAVDNQQEVGHSVQDYLDAHLRGPRRKVFDALRGRIQRSATHREHLRFCRTQGFSVIKSLAAAMGRDLADRGILDRSNDIFQLRVGELFEVYDGDMSATRAKAVVARRQILDHRYRRLVAPARFVTRGSRYTQQELEAAGWGEDTGGEFAPAGTVLTGTPSSPGVVTGRAVVVESPNEFSGGILVTYRTEPGFASALPFASALLIERASPLTHVAIIARELGIPTVVQIDGLTDAIRTGMTVRVDGATGRVVVLEEKSP